MTLRAMMAAALCACAGRVGAAPPHLVFILADDLGWHDTSVFGDQSRETRAATANMTALADDGVRLSHHYVHWHCSPTRRSFVSGRLPLHHGEGLSAIDGDDLDLRWRWVSEMLADEGYVGHWYGKGHTGYKSMQHLPANRGFAGGSVLYLTGAGSYYTLARMNGTEPWYTQETAPHQYSTDLFGSLAVSAVEAHDATKPMFLYLPWQAVHTPYDLPPHCDAAGPSNGVDPKIRTMIKDVDRWVGALTAALKKKGMYDNTLIVFSSDNGGAAPNSMPKSGGGNNYPLRGQKHSNWQGGMRTQTFVSGGYVPARLRGTTNDGTYHVVDWYPTFCKLAGGTNCDDASPVAPLPVDPAHPSKDIYQGEKAWPSVDGRDIWGSITAGAHSAPEYLWLSEQVMIQDGRYKIVVAQQEPGLAAGPVSGWRQADGSWVDGPKIDGAVGCGVAFQHRSHFRPCLFDLSTDEREEHDLSAARPELLQALWKQLNTTQLTRFTSRSPAALLGACNETCAEEYWTAAYRGSFPGPYCGVPGCGH
eukprot:TRINITY_DN3371_c0_g1_i1.p2 TRINITY_DN3371_c0_g1~~TRINITY_DN3371_c0_g1_i1.p2  ORF type:complete len:533 (+),score=206.33 TRINITY_DN3371_c0_g1_i1:66-1664(+)